MPTCDDYRALLADGTRKGPSPSARGKRSQKLIVTFPGLGDMNVLDLGRTSQFWSEFPNRPAQVTLVNLMLVQSPADWIKTVTGDACSPLSPSGTPGSTSSSPTRSSSTSVVTCNGSASPRLSKEVLTGTGSRHRIGTSQSSRTGSFPACSSCRCAFAPRSRNIGRSAPAGRGISVMPLAMRRRLNCSP